MVLQVINNLMTMIDAYKTIEGTSVSEFEEKKSKFITHMAHVESEEEATAFITEIREKYPDARHHCYAYILNEQNRVRYSDDGEPQKTAGLPILTVLEGADLKDVVAVVVRYFGGTLLGTGGLVRAYTRGPQDALAEATVLEMKELVRIEITTSYDKLEQTKFVLEQQGAQIDDISYTDKVSLRATMLKEVKESLAPVLQELFSGEKYYEFSPVFTGVF